MPTPDSTADDIAALRTALAAAELARQEAEARATGAEAMVAHPRHCQVAGLWPE